MTVDLALAMSGAATRLAHSTDCDWAPASAAQIKIGTIPFTNTRVAVLRATQYIMDRTDSHLGCDRTFGYCVVCLILLSRRSLSRL